METYTISNCREDFIVICSRATSTSPTKEYCTRVIAYHGSGRYIPIHSTRVCIDKITGQTVFGRILRRGVKSPNAYQQVFPGTEGKGKIFAFCIETVDLEQRTNVDRSTADNFFSDLALQSVDRPSNDKKSKNITKNSVQRKETGKDKRCERKVPFSGDAIPV